MPRAKLDLLDKAVRTLRLAVVYAEDGAVMTASELAGNAITLLKQEQVRRDVLLNKIARTRAAGGKR